VHRSHTALLASVLLTLAGTAPDLAAQRVRARFSQVPVEPVYDSAMVERTLDSLPLRARVAQVVMPWIPGSYASFDDSAFAVMQGWVDSLGVGGIIVSVGSPLDVAMKLNRLQRRSALPLLIAADLESGASFRLNGATPFPPNMGVAAAGSEQDAYEIGRITALEGRAVGIQLAFAPVADVNNNPANPIINTRSYGEDPYQVGRLVAANIRGLQDHGMLATAKHFPGHGDTEVDSHLGLPVIPVKWSRLDTLELVPFRAAIQAGVALVMSGHVAMPGVASDPRRPATLDPAILTGILRDSLKFEGLVVTDALDMAGVVSAYGAGEAAVRAFLAGSDLLLMPADPGQALETMTEAIETGRVTYERLDRSVRRMLWLKRRLGLFTSRTVPLDSVPEVVGAARFLQTARDMAQRAVVLVSDSLGTVDSLRAQPRTIALVTYGEENAGTVGNTLLRQLRNAGHTLTLFRLWPASGPASFDSVRVLAKKTPYTLFALSVKVTTAKGTIGLPEPIAKLVDDVSRRRRTAVLSLGSPYIGLQVPHLRSYLLAWSANGLNEWAAARALSGLAAITGRLPVRLPPAFPRGHGLDRGLPNQP
jgi:beta-N-acetylhexosaminidase